MSQSNLEPQMNQPPTEELASRPGRLDSIPEEKEGEEVGGRRRKRTGKKNTKRGGSRKSAKKHRKGKSSRKACKKGSRRRK